MPVRIRSQTVVLYYHTSRKTPPPSVETINERISAYHYVTPFVIDYLLLSVPEPSSFGGFSHVYFLRLHPSRGRDIDVSNPYFSFLMEYCDVFIPFNHNKFRSLYLPIDPHVMATFNVVDATSWSSLQYKNVFYYFITSLLPPDPKPTLIPIESAEPYLPLKIVPSNCYLPAVYFGLAGAVLLANVCLFLFL